MNIEDEDSQDLNNPMVNDLVSKILDEDSIAIDTFRNSYNSGNTHYQTAEFVNAYPNQIGDSLDGYLTDVDHLEGRYPGGKSTNSTYNNVKSDYHRTNNLCNDFNILSLNARVGQLTEQSNACSNELSSNAYSSDTRAHVVHSNDASMYTNGGNMPLCNDLLTTTTTSEVNYSKQSGGWTEPLLTPSMRCNRSELMGNYSRIPSCAKPDLNFNVALTLALDSPNSTVPINELEYNNSMRHNCTPSNSYGGNQPMVGMHDMYSVSGNTAQSLGYRPSSAMTDLNAESVFLPSSPLQHFSPADTTNLHTCFGSSMQRNDIGDFAKDTHDTARLNMTSISSIPNEQAIQFLQQHARSSYKLDQAVDQDYKTLIDYYSPGTNNFIASSANNLDTNENVCLPSDCRIDNNLLKMISPKSKSVETKTYSPIGFPKNLSSRNLYQPMAKYGCHGYQQYTASSGGDTLKILPQNSAFYHNDPKQPKLNAYKLDGFDLTKEMAFPSASHLTDRIAGSALDKDAAFGHIMKQHHISKIQSIPAGIPPPDIIFNSRMISGANTVRSGAFPSVMPVPVPVPLHPVPRLFSTLYGGSLSFRNSASGAARKTGPSSILHFNLEQTYEQFKQLEKERKKCEAGLAAHFPGKRVTSANNIPIPRPQGNPSRVDRLVIDYLREHARVITLIAKVNKQ